MKIYITTHGRYEDYHISLCTIDYEFAIKHFLDYSKTAWYNSMANIQIWENNNQLFEYGSMNYDVINNKKVDDITYEDIKNDILKQIEL